MIALCNQAENSLFFILEIKSQKDWYGKFQADLIEYIHLIEEVLQKNPSKNPILIQSFDVQLLNTYHYFFPTRTFGLLVENEKSIAYNLNLLGFKPSFYNQDYHLISEKNITELHSLNIKTIAWTVNDDEIGKKLNEWKIDGIITDNPLIFIQK